MKNKIRQPQLGMNTEELRALLMFALDYGSRWKSKLRDEWMTGRIRCPLLQSVRNKIGPRGIDRVSVRVLSGWIKYQELVHGGKANGAHVDKEG